MGVFFPRVLGVIQVLPQATQALPTPSHRMDTLPMAGRSRQLPWQQLQPQQQQQQLVIIIQA